MDELTVAYLRRLVRLKGRGMAALAVGALGAGWMIPDVDLADGAALFALMGAWVILGWAAADRTEGIMAATLALSAARRSWLAAYLIGAALFASFISFLCLLPHGIRASLGAALIALVFGWMIGALGMTVLLRSSRPQEAVWIGGAALLFAVMSASPGARTTLWHPFGLLKWGLQRALLSGSSLTLPLLREPPVWGSLLPLALALLAWRWTLRTLDRMELQSDGR